MHWTHLLAATICAGLVSSMTDWFFAGDWIHRRYTYPEVWRKGSETRAVLISGVLPFVTCAAFIVVARRLDLRSFRDLIKLAILAWLMAPLPLILTNAAFIKLHRVFVSLYSIGWLLKLLIAAVAASLAYQ